MASRYYGVLICPALDKALYYARKSGWKEEHLVGIGELNGATNVWSNFFIEIIYFLQIGVWV